MPHLNHFSKSRTNKNHSPANRPNAAFFDKSLTPFCHHQHYFVSITRVLHLNCLPKNADFEKNFRENSIIYTVVTYRPQATAILLKDTRIQYTLANSHTPSAPSTEKIANKALTEIDKLSVASENGELAISLLSDSELDPELKHVVEAWPELSVELRRAIGRMVR